jgi:hypothetical protein
MNEFMFINLKKNSAYSLLVILISGGLVIKANAAPVIPAPIEPVPTRTLINSSFEEPAFPNSGQTWISLDNYIPGDDTTLQGWFSTHPTTGYIDEGLPRFLNDRGIPFTHLVELYVNNYEGVTAPDGNQLAELNAQANSALYQDIMVFAGESIPWTVSHRGRAKTDIADIAEVFISDPLNWTGATFNGSKLYSSTIATSKDGSVSSINPIVGNVADSSFKTPLANGWVKYSDTWAGPLTSKKYRFAFQAVSTASGNNAIGNFLDDIQIKLSPIVDFVDPKISEINPVGNSIYYLPVRVNGQSESTATVEIDVSLGGNDYTEYTLQALASGTNGVVANGITATKLANGNIQVTIPANSYDPNNPSDYISVPINFDRVTFNQDRVARFTIVNVSGGGGNGVQNLFIPPADSGFATSQETTIKRVIFPD